MSILDSHAIAASVAAVIEIAGVAVLVIGGVYSALRFVYSLSQLATRSSAYSNLRRDLGRSILLGLEILVAGDIVATVAIEPTLRSVAVLGLIVIVRTFLSISLEVEIHNRWPWSKQPEKLS